MNRRESMTNTRLNNTSDQQKKNRFGTVSIFLREGLNRFHGANLTLSSDLESSFPAFPDIFENQQMHILKSLNVFHFM